MNFITDAVGREISPTNPFPVRDVGFSHEREAVSGETLTFITGAAGFAGKVATDKGPIANLAGDNVGSFWRKLKNLRAATCESAKVTAVVETATAATVTIVDTERNLEQLFESPAASARAVIELTDRTGGTLYGYIGGITASSGTYVLSVYSEAALSTQSWVGTLGSFAFADGTKFRIYSNETSIAWTTGTVLTQEVDLPDNFMPENETAFLDGLSNGQYGVDYARGVVYYKKATTGTSDTIAYSILKQYETASISGTVTVDSEFPAAAAAADNTANPTTTNVMAMNMLLDGTTWDRAPGDSTNGALVNLGTNNDVDTELPAAVLLADNADVPIAPAVGAFNMVYDGSKFDMQRGDATDGTLVNLGTNNDVTVTSGAITETNSGSIKTAVELIDDAIYTDGSGTPSKGIAVMGTDGTNPQILAMESSGNAKVAEQYMPQAEDNTNGVYAMANKPLAASTYAWSTDISAALEASSVTKNAAGTVRIFSGRIDSTQASGTYYVQLLDASSLPADGAVTFLCAPLKVVHVTGTDSPFHLDFTDNCIYASTGIVWCLSSTEFTKTIGGNYISATVLFK